MDIFIENLYENNVLLSELSALNDDKWERYYLEVAYIIKPKRVSTYVMRDELGIVGIIYGNAKEETAPLDIKFLYIKENYRGQGYARKLVYKLIEDDSQFTYEKETYDLRGDILVGIKRFEQTILHKGLFLAAMED